MSDVKKDNFSPVYFNGVQSPEDKKWKNHITAKKHLKIRRKHLCWLDSEKSTLSLGNKLLLYKTILKPIWTNGVQPQLSNSTTLPVLNAAPWLMIILTSD